MTTAEHLVTHDARQVFARQDFVVIPGIYDQNDATRALKQLRLQIKYFSRPQLLDDTNVRVSKLSSRSILDNTGLGRVIEAVSETGIDLELDLDEEVTEHAGSTPQKRKGRVQAYELPNRSSAAYTHTGRGVAAVTALGGRLWVWSASGQHSELLEPGDVAFTSVDKYRIEPYVGESATALILAGQRLGAGLPRLPDLATS